MQPLRDFQGGSDGGKVPFKSKAQQRKMFELEKQGKIKSGTAEQWAKETPNIDKLPERKNPVRSIEQLKVIARRRAKK